MSYTPSTDEMEENYIYARYDHGPLETAEDAGGEWDRGITKVRREAKAEALREAAATLDHWQSAEAHIGDPACEGPRGASAAYSMYESAVEEPAEWLREQAEALRPIDGVDWQILDAQQIAWQEGYRGGWQDRDHQNVCTGSGESLPITSGREDENPYSAEMERRADQIEQEEA